MPGTLDREPPRPPACSARERRRYAEGGGDDAHCWCAVPAADFQVRGPHYLADGKGFTSRRAMRTERDESDYDQLARFGEWDATDEPTPEALSWPSQ